MASASNSNQAMDTRASKRKAVGDVPKPEGDDADGPSMDALFNSLRGELLSAVERKLVETSGTLAGALENTAKEIQKRNSQRIEAVSSRVTGLAEDQDKLKREVKELQQQVSGM